MKRTLISRLNYWKSKVSRKPLLLRGARQVGKTHLVRTFGRQYFDQVIEINLELEPHLKSLFTSLDAHEIVRNIQFGLGQKIIPGSTLLFLDEIQSCPQALSSLRYFHEQLSDLHVIAAGSLVEFLLSSEQLHVPVGRMEYLYLQPFTFTEFLEALGELELLDFLSWITFTTTVPPAVDHKLNHLFKTYLLVGGMPEAIGVYLKNPDLTEFQEVQNALLQTYRDDFGKYAQRTRLDYLQKVYLTAPFKVGEIYKYSHIDRNVQIEGLKHALQLLVRAGIITKVHASGAHGLPLMKDINEKKFKILFLDVGLMQRACGLEADLALTTDLVAVNSGAIAEQYIGQQLLSLRNPDEAPELYFWSREKRNSQAEVDFLTTIHSTILPVEVKSGKTGTLRSLRLFLQEFKAPFGIRFSQLPPSFHDRILSLPLYAVGHLERIARTLL